MKFTDTRFPSKPLLEVLFHKYATGETAIQLMEDATGEPWAYASVAINKPMPGHVAVKNWSENEGMTQLLINAKIIEPTPVEWVAQGFVRVGIYKLTPDAAKIAAAV